jgi:hypothetical protein
MKILLNRNVKLLFFVLCTCLSILILQNVSKVQAQANSVINFQGKIVDRVSGVNVVSGSPSCVVAGASNDTCDIRVNIYTDSGGGTLMFQEVHSNKEIGEYNGVFNIQINSVCNTWSGSASPPAGCTATPTVSGITWGNDPTIYIEIQLDADGNGDFSSPETFSRKLLNSVPYAYYADNAGSVDGISSENIVQLQPSGAQSASGSNTLIFLNETGGSTPNLMQLQVGGSNRFTITNNGQVNLADSTTGSSQINFGTGGGTPSTPTEGDMWYTGTSLNFFDGSTTHDLLAAGGGSLFTDGGSVTYLTSTTDDLAIGGSTLANSIFGVDVSSGDIQIGAVGSVDPSINIENSTGEVLNIDYEVGNILNINSASGNTKIGLNKTAPDYELDVDGSIQVTGSIFSDTTVSSVTSYQSVNPVGGTGVDQGTSIVTDSDNNIYAAGTFQGTVDFDPGVGTDNKVSNGAEDFFLTKYDHEGNYQWTRAIGGTGADEAEAMITDGKDNVYVVGAFQDTVDFNPTAVTENKVSAGGYDAFVTKYDKEGNYIWTKTFGTGGAQHSLAVDVDAGDNVFTVGMFQGTVDFDPNAGTDNKVSNGGADIFITKYDEYGNYIVTRTVGGTLADHGRSIFIDSSSNVYVSGWFQDTTDFNPFAGTDNKVSNGGFDIFVSKYNSNLGYSWTTTVGGTTNDIGYDVAADSNSNVYMTGVFTDTVDFDPGGGTENRVSNGSGDIFIAKYDSSGAYQWVNAVGSTSDDNGISIAIDSDANVYSVGFYNGTADFDPTGDTDSKSNSGSSDGFLTKYDSAGNYLWTDTLGNTGGDSILDLAINLSGLSYLVGYFGNTVDFDLGPGTDNKVSNGSSDVFTTIYSISEYSGSDIGSTTDPFANMYTYGLSVLGFSTFEEDISTVAPSESLGSASTISSTGDVGRQSEIVIGSNGLPFIAAYDATNTQVQTVGCNNITCSSPTITNYSGTGGIVGDFELNILNRHNGFPIVFFMEDTNDDSEAVDCTTVTCSTGNPRSFLTSITPAGYSTAWIRTSTGFPVLGYTRTPSGITTAEFCTAITCASIGAAYNLGTDQAGDESQHLDVVVKTDGLPLIMSTDVDSGGEFEIINCTNDQCGTFEATRVMEAGNNGEHVEVILGKDTLPLAVYRDVTNQSIKLIKCKDIICGDIDIRTIRDTADNLGVNQFGIALKGDGSPVISYHNETTGTLNVYECASVECSTGTNHVLTSTGDQGEYSSMVRVPGNKDRFLISYYDRTGGDLEMFDFNKTYTGGVSLGTSTNYFANLYTANIYTKNATINNFDVAEEYIAADETIEAGDIVRFTEETDNTKESLIKVEKTDKRYDNRAIGVISTEPGLYLKNWDQNIQGSRPVALVGRVPVKVTDENGEIRRGDYITASSTPGYGMRARSGGMIIGRAMEDFKGGDSTNVREFIEKEREEAEELLKQYEEEENPDEEQINILKQKIEELYEQEQNIESTRGRIMMYVDLTYIPEENFEEKEEIIEAFETEEAENTEEIDKLTKLSQYIESTDNTVTITAEKLIINGALSVTGDLEVSGNLTAQNAYIQEWIIRNQIKIENDQIKGSVTMPSGQTEITVASQALTEDSLILLSVPNRISYELEKDIPNKTFKAILKEPLLEDLNITYLIIN